jgi:hypothetical protein
MQCNLIDKHCTRTGKNMSSSARRSSTSSTTTNRASSSLSISISLVSTNDATFLWCDCVRDVWFGPIRTSFFQNVTVTNGKIEWSLDFVNILIRLVEEDEVGDTGKNIIEDR